VATVSVLLVGLVTACSPPGTVLAGSVTMSGGTSAGQVTIEVHESVSSATPSAVTKTNLGGGFDISSSALADGSYVVKVAGKWWTGHGVSADPADAVPVTVSSSARTTIAVQLNVAATLVGKVIDQAGVPVAGQLVVAKNATGGVVAFGATDSDGTFGLPLASPGAFHMGMGDPDAGMLVAVGDGSPTTYSVTEGQTLDVGTLALTTAVAVTAGRSHSCALLATGRVACWGSNSTGQLGDGTTTNSPVPVLVTGIDDAAAVVAGSTSSCALGSTGTVSCWGANADGQLGDGSTTPSPVPVPVSGVSDATALALGPDGTTVCVVRATGSVACWGNNTYGQLGDGSTTPSSTSKAVPTLVDMTSIDASDVNVCARRVSGAYSCWGAVWAVDFNLTPYLAPGPGPGDVPYLDDATSIGVGHAHVCDTMADGSVHCNGLNLQGQLGGPTSDPFGGSVTVAGENDAIEVVAGYTSSCAVRQGGSVSCWGLSGSLGNGSTAGSRTPVPVSNLVDATALAAGHNHTCALRATGGVVCWGTNAAGQIGDGTNVTASTPQPVSGLPVVVTAAP
jgi:alpha-tubulin suppressor-like RCC1 family protein